MWQQHDRICRVRMIRIVLWMFLIINLVSSTLYKTETANKDMTSSFNTLYSVNATSLVHCSLYCELKASCSSFTLNPRSLSSTCMLYSSKTPTFNIPENGREHYIKQFEVDLPDSCNNITKSGYYYITKSGVSVRVYCHDGWTYVQRREIPEKWGETFKTDINNYIRGFGDYYDLTYWIGNDDLHLLTKDGEFALQVYFAGPTKEFYVLFERFRVGSYLEKYRLTIGHMKLYIDDIDDVYQDLLMFDGMEFYAPGFGDPAPASSTFFNGGGWWKPNASSKACLNCYDENGIGQIRYGDLVGSMSLMRMKKK